MVPIEAPSLDELAPLAVELLLVAAMVAVLLVPFRFRRGVTAPLVAALIGLAAAAAGAIWTLASLPEPAVTGDVSGLATRLVESTPGRTVLDGALVVDPFSQAFKLLLLAFTAAVVLLRGGLVGFGGDDGAVGRRSVDYLLLLLGATLGLATLASANSLLTMLLAMECASLCSFALVGYRKGATRSAEAALKYAVFGAACSAVMIYGMSLVYGATGTLRFEPLAFTIAAAPGAGFSPPGPMLALGMMAVLVGVAFKLAVVPMHFWCPDAFDGAPVDVAAYLSAASKAAALVLLARLLCLIDDAYLPMGTVEGRPALAAWDSTGKVAATWTVALLGAVTATWGNLAALGQVRIKRLLAYSSIAQAGYMVMAAAAVFGGVPGAESTRTVAMALIFYLAVYFAANLGVFTAAAVILQAERTSDIRRYAGLARRSPWLVVAMAIGLLSLFGLPGLGGFLGKVLLMRALTLLDWLGFALIAILLLNTVLSLAVYLRPIYYMVLVTPEDESGRSAPPLSLRPVAAGLLGLSVAATIWTGLDLGATRGAVWAGRVFTLERARFEHLRGEPVQPPEVEPVTLPGEEVGP